MNRRTIWIGLGALAALVLLIIGVAIACQISAPDAADPTEDPGLVLTEVYQNAETMRAATATALGLTPSPTEITLTPTLDMTSTATLAPALTPSLGPTSPPGSLRVVFGDDITVPDGTVFAPNTPFIKTWRLINGGTVSWTPAFSLVFMSGEQMSAPPAVPLTVNVLPGGTVDISVNMIAPAAAGRYIGNWMMRDPGGLLFGIDPEAKYPIYVDITVSATGTGTPSPAVATATLQPGTPSPTVSSLVTNVTLVVDNPSATSCPHTFNFTATFSLSQSSSVTYRLEAGSNDPNVIITVPPQVTTAYPAGTQTLIYTLDFASAVSGWAQFHVLAPNDVISNRVNFSLACSP
jgi:hypothetical protein